MGKMLVGAALTLLMLCRPEAAANGAREALRQWYFVVAPSLFPYMALMPLLTCPEASRFYEKALGGVMARLFALPGGAASPVIVGMIAGSPAGCVAVGRVAAEAGFTRGDLERVAMACCGMSPAFFISAVGTGMLGDAAAGHLLLRSQIMAQLAMLNITRLFCANDAPVEASNIQGANGPVISIINVAGWMALFGAIAGTLDLPWAQLGLDITAGSKLVCGAALDARWKLPALSALAGYGGLCVCAQNIGALKQFGINPVKFMSARCLAGLLAAGFTALQTRIRWATIPSIDLEILNISCIMAVILAIPTIFRLKRTIF